MMQTLLLKQEIQIIYLKWLLLTFNTNRVQAVDDIDKLCKFHENLYTNADYCVNKKCEFAT